MSAAAASRKGKQKRHVNSADVEALRARVQTLSSALQKKGVYIPELDETHDDAQTVAGLKGASKIGQTPGERARARGNSKSHKARGKADSIRALQRVVLHLESVADQAGVSADDHADGSKHRKTKGKKQMQRTKSAERKKGNFGAGSVGHGSASDSYSDSSRGIFDADVFYISDGGNGDDDDP